MYDEKQEYFALHWYLTDKYSLISFALISNTHCILCEILPSISQSKCQRASFKRTDISKHWHQPALAPIARSATYVVTSGITSQCTLSYWSKLTTISLFYLALFAFYLQLYHDSLSTQCFVQWKCCVCCMYCYFLKAKYDMYICYTRDKCRPVITFLGEFMISNWY